MSPDKRDGYIHGDTDAVALEVARSKVDSGPRKKALDSPSHAPRLLSVKEAAAYLSVSPWTIRSLGWNGEIPEVKIGRRVLYDRADLDQFIERSKRRQG